MNDFIDFFKNILIPVFILILIFIVPLGIMIYFYDKTSCANYSSITGRETRFTFAGGCFVKTTDSWLTKDEYGKVIIAREGLSVK